MKCPFCGAEDTAVADTRLNDEGDVVRRRRKCNACDKRFTTYERAEIQLPQVVKKNGLRTEFSRGKLRASLELALRKRPVSIESVDAAVVDIEEMLLTAGEREVTTQQLGELVMRELKKLDKVAYIRFASVYRSFQDVDDFRDAIEAVAKPQPKRRRTPAGR